MSQHSNGLRSSIFHHLRVLVTFTVLVTIICLPAANFAAIKFNFLGNLGNHQGADYLYYTPGLTLTWGGKSSDASSTPFPSLTLGTANSRIVPADYNGDSITDAGVFLSGAWSIRLIAPNGIGTPTGSIINASLGVAGDIPMAGNFFGSREAEIAVFHPATGEWTIKTLPTSPIPNQVTGPFNWGLAGDIPVPEDYDGDCILDIAIYRPSSGDWWIKYSAPPQATQLIHFGGDPTDIPVPEDYDGDGKADPAVFRSSNATWYILQSLNGIKIKQFGNPPDVPVPADYNGDGMTDIAVFNGGNWTIDIIPWPAISSGTLGDVPIPGP